MGFCVCLCVCETGSRAAELSPQGSPTLGQQSSTSEDIWVLRKPLAGKLKACFCGGKKEMMCVRHVVCVCVMLRSTTCVYVWRWRAQRQRRQPRQCSVIEQLAGLWKHACFDHSCTQSPPRTHTRGQHPRP